MIDSPMQALKKSEIHIIIEQHFIKLINKCESKSKITFRKLNVLFIFIYIIYNILNVNESSAYITQIFKFKTFNTGIPKKGLLFTQIYMYFKALIIEIKETQLCLNHAIITFFP